MSAHTPGPWEFLESGHTEAKGNACRPLTICSADRDDLANIYSRDDATVTISREEAIANAILIAAAPELLEALLAIVKEAGSQFGNDDGPGSVNRMAYFARAAIAKATGAA